MLTDQDMARIGRMLDEKLDEKLKPVIDDLRFLTTKVNQMWDALERHGLPLIPA